MNGPMIPFPGTGESDPDILYLAPHTPEVTCGF